MDTEEFFKRVDAAKQKSNLIDHRGFVEYLDMSKHNGDRTILQKDKAFEFQQEYRIMFVNDTYDPLHVYLGSLEDISTIYEMEYVDHLSLMINIPSNLEEYESGKFKLKKKQGD